MALAVVIGLGAPLSAGAQTPETTTERPNVLIIVTDDQRVETMRAMPATRRLFGAQGTRFTNAYATTPLCCPARASIMSGKYAHNHGIRTGETGQANTFEQSATIQKELKLAGYRTAAFGKFLNGWDLNQSPTYFDDWAIFSHSSPEGYYGGTWNVDGTLQEVLTYSTDYITQRASKFIEDSEATDEQPWYMYLAPAAPHFPFIAEPRYAHSGVGRWEGNPAVFETDRSDKPAFVQRHTKGIGKGRDLRRRQLRTLMSVDQMVLSVLDKMTELGEDDTLAIYLSDNGFMWGEHGLIQKRYPYAASVRVPMFLRWPGVVGMRVVDDRLAANIDVAPTVFTATEIAPSYEVDGRSLLGSERRSRLLLEFFTAPGRELPSWAATVTESFQYVEYYSEPGVPSASEYYDLGADPWQLDNLLGDTDLTNDPDVTALSLQLSFDRSCESQDCP